MKYRTTGIFMIALIFLIVNLPAAGENEKSEKTFGFLSYLLAGKKMPVVKNDKLKQFCKECHWVYLPGLLPKKSWEKLMGSLDDHFGDSIKIDETSQKEILEYLQQNASDYTSSKVSMKIMKSSGSDEQIEISKIKYIKKVHEDIEEEMWKHPDIKFRGNCIACHREVDKTGVFNEHDVELPEK